MLSPADDNALQHATMSVRACINITRTMQWVPPLQHDHQRNLTACCQTMVSHLVGHPGTRLQLVDVGQQEGIRAVENGLRTILRRVLQQQADLQIIIKAVNCASFVSAVHHRHHFNRLGACPSSQKRSGELSPVMRHDCHSLMM